MGTNYARLLTQPTAFLDRIILHRQDGDEIGKCSSHTPGRSVISLLRFDLPDFGVSLLSSHPRLRYEGALHIHLSRPAFSQVQHVKSAP